MGAFPFFVLTLHVSFLKPLIFCEPAAFLAKLSEEWTEQEI